MTLTPADRDAAFALLEEWTGVAPKLPAQPRTLQERSFDVRDAEPRVPPAMVRALRARLR